MRRGGFALAITGSVVIALLLALLHGDSIESAETEGPDSRTITLNPGDNFIGWIAEPLSLEDLFEEIPQAELVYRWDPRAQRYEYAIPGINTSRTPLDALTAETSAVIQIGDEALAVRELFEAAPDIDLVYRWDASSQRWRFALRHISPEHWTLTQLDAETRACSH